MFNPIKDVTASVETTSFGKTKDGREVTLFRIPNSTEDYIEVTDYGCTIKSLYIHDWSGKSYVSMLCGFETLREYEESSAAVGSVLGGAVTKELTDMFSHKVWDVQEVGPNYVFLSCRAEAGEAGLKSGLTVGAKIQWVNLNRLVVDLYATPDEDMPINFTLNLLYNPNGGTLDGYAVRTFSPNLAEKAGSGFSGNLIAVGNTAYADMAFVPIKMDTFEAFVDAEVGTHPVAEMICEQAGMSISAYTTMPALELSAVSEPCKAVRLNAQMFTNTADTSEQTSHVVKGGESWSARIIYGFDHTHAPDESMNPELNLLSVFCH